MDSLCADELHQELAHLLGLADAAALAGGAWVGSERVLVIRDDELDDGTFICIDAGPIDPHAPLAEVLAALLDLNLELSAHRGESFGIEAESGHVLFRAFRRSGEFTPASLADDIRGYVAFFSELRSGPLAFCARPSDTL